ncbi:MAG TPA: MerR family transcriptional regulator [Acidimicrobiales bacterium]
MSDTPFSPDEGFSGKRAADIVGISYRQLDYWARTDLIRPSLADAHGSGSRRRYTYRDLLELKLVKTLLDNGIKLESIREAFGYLREQLGTDVSTARLVIAGTSAVLVRENDELIDVVNRYQGQGVLNLLALDGVKEQVDAAIVELFPSEQAPSAGGGGEGATGRAAAARSARVGSRATPLASRG